MRKEPHLSLVLLLFVVTMAKAQTDSIEAFWAQVDFSNHQSYAPKPEFEEVNFEKYNIIIDAPQSSYNSLKAKIDQDRLKMKELYESGEITLDSVSRYFEHKIVNSIIPYWYGTPWDFDGYTDKPNEGFIACGYFVSTTMKHMGINWNRYKMAQQASLHEVKTVVGKNEYHSFRSVQSADVIEKIKLLPEGLYIVGLSNHVGFIYHKMDEVFFLHSNYGFPNEVVIELASYSEAFYYSFDYYLGAITRNDELMKHWLKGDNIPIVTN